MHNSRLNQTNLPYSPINGNANGMGKGLFGSGKITSSPISAGNTPWKKRLPISTFTSSRTQSPLSAPRYNLSDMSPNTSGTKSGENTPKSKRTPNVTGPLLASTRFNVNLGTYTDSKSPGLASRLVQYDDEKKQEKQVPTHQPKYGSPGLFPVVHLFKKDLPVISPKKVSVRMVTPESCTYGTQEQTRIIMESLPKESTSVTQNGNSLGEPDASTRSVLDALKEISRKRIHAGLETDEDELKKRQRKEFANNLIDSSKRLREESPPHPENTHLAKRSKPCIGAMEASYSSSKILEYLMQCTQQNRSFSSPVSTPEKRPEKKKESTPKVKPTNKEVNKKTLIHVETQTSQDESAKRSVNSAISKEVNKNNITINTPKKPIDEDEDTVPRLIQFDDKPREIQMKNKLSSILASIQGIEPVLEPITTPTLRDPPPKNDPVSILSSPNKEKHDKHVRFSSEISTSTDITTFSKECTVSTSSIASPITSFASPPKQQESLLKATCETPKSVGTEQGVNATKVLFGNQNKSTAAEAASTPKLTFGAPINNTPTVSSTTGGFNITPVSNTTTEVSKPSFSFGSVTPASQPSLNSTEKPSGEFSFGQKLGGQATEPPKVGGFKFDLTKSDSSVKENAPAPVLSVPKTTPTNSMVSTAPTFKFGGSDAKSPSSASFSSTLFGNTTTSAPTTTSAALSFGTPNNAINFGSGNTLATNSPASTANTSNLFGNIKAAATSAPTFGASSDKPATVSSGLFGSTTSTNSGFGANTAPPAFGTNSTSTPTFGTPTKNIFGSISSTTTSTTTTSATATTNTFGSNATFGSGFQMSSTANTVTSSTASFKAPISSATFSSGNNAIFGNTQSTKPSMFGTTATTTSSGFSSFGAATSTSSMFGNTTTASTSAPTFGANTNVFGAPGNTTAPSAFGSTNTTNSLFGSTNVATTASSFGGGNTFGSGNNAPVFGGSGGFGNTTTTTTSSTPAFGGSGGFGNNTTTTTAATTPAFGAPTTTAAFTFGKSATPAFGSTTTASMFNSGTNTNTFGSSSGFGSSTTSTTSTFGNNPSSFTAPTAGFQATPTPTPAFGAPAANTTSSGFSSGFGSNTDSKPAFGSGSNVFAFGGAKTTAPAFGTTNTPTTTASGFGNSGAFAFGSTTTQASSFPSTSAPAAFGSSTFGNNTTTTTAFGSNTTPAFGASNNTAAVAPFGSSTFGNTAAPNFNAGSGNAFGSSGSSSFGAGSTFGTTNNTFGNGNTSGFGNTNANTFGTAPATANATASPFGGAANNNSTFGAAQNNQPSAFGATNNTNTGFGNNAQATPAFGSTNAAGGVFSFGASAPAPSSSSTSSGVFAFGSSTDKPKTSGFNFSAGTSTPAFGSSTPAFGATAPTPQFGASNPTPQFGAGAPTPQFGAPAQGMFSIGTGGNTTNRQRTLKAKRRT